VPQGLENEMIANGILYAGQPEIQELEALTVTSFAPGRCVITDTNQWSCQTGTAASIIVLGVADVPSDKKLTEMQTETAAGTPLVTFTAGDQIRVLRGDIVVKVLLKSGQTITVGEKLESAALGMVQTASVDQAVIGFALEDITSGNYCKWILMKMTI
jgi:hypothetical protein